PGRPCLRSGGGSNGQWTPDPPAGPTPDPPGHGGAIPTPSPRSRHTMTRQRLAVDELERRDVPAAAPFDTLPVLPAADPAVLDTARAVLAVGQSLGRR